MKKYLIIFSALVLAAAGCMKFEHETPMPRVYADAPSFTNTAVKDSSFSMTITPANGTGYYSYAVVQGPAQKLDSMKVFQVAVSSAMQAATMSAAKVPSFALSMNDLQPNTDYTVYAVSSSTQGSVGKLVSKTIHTTDIVAPFIKVAEIRDTVVTLYFSEDVVKAEKAEFTVKYYGFTSKTTSITEDKPFGTVVPDVKLDGNIVRFCCGPVPDGAYYTLSYSEGAFLDAAGNKCEALASAPFYVNKSGKISNDGIAGRKPTKEFELSIYGGKPVTVVTAMNGIIRMSIPEGVEIGVNHSLTETGTIVYATETSGGSKIETFTTSGKTYDFGWNGTYKYALAYPNAGKYYTGRDDPERGAYVTMNIPSYLEDVYGNMNAPFVVGPFLFSYGYKLDDVIGTYSVDAYSYFDEKTVTFPMVIEESNDAKKGNVMISSLFGATFDSDCRVYATFDTDMGVLTIPDWQKISYSEKYKGYWTFAVYGADFVTLSMPKSGELDSLSDYIGFYIDITSGGWGGLYTTFSAKKTASASCVACAADDARIVSTSRIVR